MAIRLEMGARSAAPVRSHWPDYPRRGLRQRLSHVADDRAGAHLAVGIDPTQLFLCQFEAVRKLLGNDQRAHLLPLGIEQLPALEAFDTVFSMGVLYHRRSPLDHLWQLKDQLAPGGELVLETLVVEGDENTVLVPGDRYAQMRNVYFIPSAAALKMWLEKCGFIDVRIVDACVTSTEEQRRTEWMTTESLADFLDPQDQRKTVEGYPAPLRAVIIATKPETQQSLAKKSEIKKRPLFNGQGPGTGNHHIGRHDVQQKTV